MESQTEVEKLVVKLSGLMDEMIQMQRTKVARTARRIRPNISEDDLRDPNSFPEVNSRPEFAYEDGILAGLISAQTAVLRDGVEFLKENQADSED